MNTATMHLFMPHLSTAKTSDYTARGSDNTRRATAHSRAIGAGHVKGAQARAKLDVVGTAGSGQPQRRLARLQNSLRDRRFVREAGGLDSGPVLVASSAEVSRMNVVLGADEFQD